MSFRVRLTMLTALAVAVAIVGTSFVVYYTDRSELLHQIDTDLKTSSTGPLVKAFGIAGGFTVPANAKPITLRQAYGNVTFTKARPSLFVLPGGQRAVRVQVTTRKGAPAGPRTATFATRTIGGVPTRVLTVSTRTSTVNVSSSLAEVDHNLAHLRWLLVLISAGGTGAAALLGAFVSRRAVAPLRKLTETTERIVDTGDLSERIGARGRDEISRLSRRLDELLATLDSSLTAQRQLVADASHELRTPLSSLRANFELLVTPGKLGAVDRAELLADVKDELESMTTLVAELVELARGEESDVEPREFRLDEVVQAAVDRAARRSPALSFEARLEPSMVSGAPERVERAVANLLDNARKWSPTGATVDVTVHDGLVEVRDHGPGIATEDVPFVFNRFYRSNRARGMPGAGLGLAIVKQIADAHGGSIAVDRAVDGGAIVRLQLSPSP